MKEEALKLADELDALHQYVPSEAPAMIRRLVEELDKACDKEMQDKIQTVEALEIGFYRTGWEIQINSLNSEIARLTQENCDLWEQLNDTSPQTKPTITKLDGKVVAVTMTDDDHRIAEVLWEAPKPLSKEEIEGAFYKKCWYYDEDEKFDYYGFTREIEERHGIK